MIRRALAAAMGMAALAATLAIGFQATAQPSRTACTSKGSETIYRNATIRIFEKRRSVYGCNFERDSIVRLGASGQRTGRRGPYVAAVTLSTEHVAFLLRTDPASSQGPFEPDRVRVVDLRARRRYAADAGCAEQPARGQKVTDLAVNDRGHVVWACLQGFADSPAFQREVRAFRAGAGTVVLDRGDGIEEGSLAMTNARVYWVHAGEVRSLALR